MARTTSDPRKMISVRLTQNTIDRLNQLSQDLGVSKSDVISLAINGGLKNKMKIRFNEACGKTQGEIIDIEADSYEEAIEKFGADEVIRPWEQFKKWHSSKVYEVYEVGHPARVEYVVHKK